MGIVREGESSVYACSQCAWFVELPTHDKELREQFEEAVLCHKLVHAGYTEEQAKRKIEGEKLLADLIEREGIMDKLDRIDRIERIRHGKMFKRITSHLRKKGGKGSQN